ncbi:hypothetical protein BH11BAC1_BH11BAC1_03350 [soil metagenome]
MKLNYAIKKNQVSLFIFLLFIEPAIAQNFQTVVGGVNEEYSNSIIHAFDGGYIMTGTTLSYGGMPGITEDIYVVKTDSLGTVEWTRSFGNADNDEALWIEPYLDKTYLICGTTFSSGGTIASMFVMRLDLYGTILSLQQFSGFGREEANCIRATNDKGYVVAGQTSDGLNDRFCVVKCDSLGTIQWSKAFSGPDQQDAFYVTQTSDSGYLVAGTSRYINNWYSLYLVKLDSSGNFMWSKMYNTDPYKSKCFVSRVLQTQDGGYILNGSSNALGQPLTDVMLLKLDSAGNILWQKVYEGNDSEFGNDIYEDGNTGFIICGQTASTSASGYYDAMLMKTDLNGNLLWTKAYGVNDSDEVFNSMLHTPDDKIVLTGYSYINSAGESDVYLFETSKEIDSMECNIKFPNFLVDTISLIAMTVNYSVPCTITQSNLSFGVDSGFNESLICSQVLGVSENNLQGDFDIYPNPSNGILNVYQHAMNENYKLEIYNAPGEKFYSGDIHFGNNNIDLNNFPGGVYLLVISSGSETIFRKLVIS